MKINKFDVSNIDDFSEASRFLQQHMDQIQAAMQKSVSFQDNIQCSIVTVSFPSTINQNLPVAHKLSVTPIGYFPIRLSAACSIYDGVSLVLGATFANLKCSVAGVTATIAFF